MRLPRVDRAGLQALSLAAMRGSTSPSTAGLALAYALCHGVRMRSPRAPHARESAHRRAAMR